MSINLQSNFGARLASFTLLIASFALVFVACDSGPDLTAQDASGTVTGKVIDQATSEGIGGVTVTVAVDSSDEFTTTTGSDGQFVLHDIPATTGANADESSSGYLVTVEAPDPYRNARGTVEMRFGSESGGTGGLRAGMTFPLSKANGSISGKLTLNTSNGEVPLDQGPVVLEQTVPVRFDAEGREQELITTTTVDTSSADGTFSFSNALVNRRADLFLALEGSPRTRVVSNQEVPANNPVELNETVNPPNFKVIDVTPSEGVDADTTHPSFTFTFNRPVASNQFVSAELSERLWIEPGNAKALTSNGDIPVDMSINGDRTELTVTAAEALQDGYNYDHEAPGFTNDDGFTDKYGVTLDNPSRGYIQFSVGINNSVPATPALSFNPDDGDVQDDGSLEPGVYNYSHFQIWAPLQVDEVDNSNVEVKAYEVYARSQNQAGRTATGDEFERVGTVDVEQDSEEDGFDDGAYEFDETLRNHPFEGDDGSYGPVEWTVRAVSINNERSAFSDTLVTPDNDSLSLDQGSTLYNDTDGDGDEELVVTFTEPVDPSSVDNNSPGNQFSIDNGGSGNLSVDAVAEINNTKASNGAEGEVIIELSGSSGTTGDDVLTVKKDGATDLAGNPADVEGNANKDNNL